MSDTGDTSIVTTGMNVAIAVCIELPALFLSLILETPLKCKKKFSEQAEVGWAVELSFFTSTSLPTGIIGMVY